MIIIHVTTYIFVLLLFLLNRLLLKFGSYIIFIRPQTFWGRIMVWRSRRRLCTFCFGCLTLVLEKNKRLNYGKLFYHIIVIIIQIQPFYEVDIQFVSTE
jgi:hypothetical protein